MKNIDVKDSTISDRIGTGVDHPRPRGRPAIFLMANEFSTGGTEIQFITLARKLKGQEFDLRLGCIRRRGPLGDSLGAEPIPEFPLDGGFITITSLRSARALARHFHENRIDVAHSFSFYSNLLMIPVARAVGVPVVIGSQRQLGDLLTPRQRFVQRACFRLCDRIVCNSDAAARRVFPDHPENGKVVVIPNAVSDKFFRVGDSRPSSEAAAGAVGLIARLDTAAKNHELFLRAAARLCLRGLSAEFFWIGDGFRRKEMERLAQQLGITRRTIFMENVRMFRRF